MSEQCFQARLFALDEVALAELVVGLKTGMIEYVDDWYAAGSKIGMASKIPAIIEVRRLTNWGLFESKKFVDEIWAIHDTLVESGEIL